MQRLVAVFRKLKGKSRKATKQALMAAAMDDPNFDDLDGYMVDVLLNYVQKLPEFKNDQAIGEQQLLTNYIDPIVTPLFHHPDYGHVFYWLNRTISPYPSGTLCSSQDSLLISAHPVLFHSIKQ